MVLPRSLAAMASRTFINGRRRFATRWRPKRRLLGRVPILLLAPEEVHKRWLVEKAARAALKPTLAISTAIVCANGVYQLWGKWPTASDIFVFLLGGTFAVLVLFIFVFMAVEAVVERRVANQPLPREVLEKQREFEAAQKRERTREIFWMRLNGHRFEHEFAELLRRKGWTAKVTRASGDGGVDIYATETTQNGSVEWVIQCKRYKERVGPETVRALIGTLSDMGTGKRGMLACPSGFTDGANKLALRNGIKLVALDWILREAKPG